ncbi:hypothetical protein CONLIGDRAFT_639032 [Coniochaeta ligniaria NRRL 30616]|uniref:Uncharacterized protein n=1 Tax=Coniochaeta ligniaria NRRL 30616 TaxID=1408157 RepID=A0A1J7JZ38_9PEZI|nr:hypothetical protein CONLIGDRAFT_639032 [Coniochaeta ligniaria NRRL 30616]
MLRRLLGRLNGGNGGTQTKGPKIDTSTLLKEYQEDLKDRPPPYEPNATLPSYLDAAILPAYNELAGPAIRASIDAAERYAIKSGEVLTLAILAVIVNTVAYSSYVNAMMDATAWTPATLSQHNFLLGQIYADDMRTLINDSFDAGGSCAFCLVCRATQAGDDTIRVIRASRVTPPRVLINKCLYFDQLKEYWLGFKAGLDSLIPPDGYKDGSRIAENSLAHYLSEVYGYELRPANIQEHTNTDTHVSRKRLNLFQRSTIRNLCRTMRDSAQSPPRR